MSALDLIEGTGGGEACRIDLARATEKAIRTAMEDGYQVGRRVAIGSVTGEIIGYNIASYGRYVGSHYPLLVSTALGVTKCGPDELRLL